MGDVVQFSDYEADTKTSPEYVNGEPKSATVTVLPIIRIERGPDKSPRGKRRRRQSDAL